MPPSSHNAKVLLILLIPVGEYLPITLAMASSGSLSPSCQLHTALLGSVYAGPVLVLGSCLWHWGAAAELDCSRLHAGSGRLVPADPMSYVASIAARHS